MFGVRSFTEVLASFPWPEPWCYLPPIKAQVKAHGLRANRAPYAAINAAWQASKPQVLAIIIEDVSLWCVCLLMVEPAADAESSMRITLLDPSGYCEGKDVQKLFQGVIKPTPTPECAWDYCKPAVCTEDEHSPVARVEATLFWYYCPRAVFLPIAPRWPGGEEGYRIVSLRHYPAGSYRQNAQGKIEHRTPRGWEPMEPAPLVLPLHPVLTPEEARRFLKQHLHRPQLQEVLPVLQVSEDFDQQAWRPNAEQQQRYSACLATHMLHQVPCLILPVQYQQGHLGVYCLHLSKVGARECMQIVSVGLAHHDIKQRLTLLFTPPTAKWHERGQPSSLKLAQHCPTAHLRGDKDIFGLVNLVEEITRPLFITTPAQAKGKGPAKALLFRQEQLPPIPIGRQCDFVWSYHLSRQRPVTPPEVSEPTLSPEPTASSSWLGELYHRLPSWRAAPEKPSNPAKAKAAEQASGAKSTP